MFFLSIILTVLEALGIASITSMVTILSNSNNYIFEYYDQKYRMGFKTNFNNNCYYLFF